VRAECTAMADAELRVLRERREVAERDLAKTEAEVKQLRAELSELQAHSRATRQSADLRLAEQHGELTMRKVRRLLGLGCRVVAASARR
jgi:chromosome segregation ATPase